MILNVYFFLLTGSTACNVKLTNRITYQNFSVNKIHEKLRDHSQLPYGQRNYSHIITCQTQNVKKILSVKLSADGLPKSCIFHIFRERYTAYRLCRNLRSLGLAGLGSRIAAGSFCCGIANWIKLRFPRVCMNVNRDVSASFRVN